MARRDGDGGGADDGNVCLGARHAFCFGWVRRVECCFSEGAAALMWVAAISGRHRRLGAMEQEVHLVVFFRRPFERGKAAKSSSGGVWDGCLVFLMGGMFYLSNRNSLSSFHCHC